MFELALQEKAQEIENWIKKTVQEAGFEKVVIAVSGGVDSATSLFLSIRAMDVENVYALLLPHGQLSKEALDHGNVVATVAGLAKDHVFTRDIEPGVEKLLEQVEAKDVTDVRRGNMMARVRMIYLFDLAKSLNALVVGTENKTEHYLGYFTRFGDEASDMEPIRNLYKTQVFELAKYLGVPKEIITKAPSANLWEGQSDEGEFGFSYIDADKVLSMAFDQGMRNGDIMKAGVDEKVVKNVLEFVQKNNFKHHLPHVLE